MNKFTIKGIEFEDHIDWITKNSEVIYLPYFVKNEWGNKIKVVNDVLIVNNFKYIAGEFIPKTVKSKLKFIRFNKFLFHLNHEKNNVIFSKDNNIGCLLRYTRLLNIPHGIELYPIKEKSEFIYFCGNGYGMEKNNFEAISPSIGNGFIKIWIKELPLKVALWALEKNL
jgi:hypothetical protein